MFTAMSTATTIRNVMRVLDFAADLDEDCYCHGFAEFKPNHFQYGLYVTCVLVVLEDGSVMDYQGTDAECFDPNEPDAQRYASIKEWAGAMLLFLVEGYDHLQVAS